MYLSIEFHEHGTACEHPLDVLYDINENTACMGSGATGGPTLRWRLGPTVPDTALLASTVELDSTIDWIVRCDRVDFPPSSVAYRHTHPGPGIRCTLMGGLTIDNHGNQTRYGPLEPWFESGPDPVHATADPDGPSAFARVMLLPAEWTGKRTITYVDPVDDSRPKLQRPTVFFDNPLPRASV